jgi:hypothetical protein
MCVCLREGERVPNVLRFVTSIGGPRCLSRNGIRQAEFLARYVTFLRPTCVLAKVWLGLQLKRNAELASVSKTFHKRTSRVFGNLETGLDGLARPQVDIPRADIIVGYRERRRTRANLGSA